MSFANPTALAWFFPLAAVIVLLYLLKMRRRELRVPATFLWPAQTDEVRVNALFQRLRPNWLLFLQLLALLLIVVGMARPQSKQSGLTGNVTVFVIDVSASMSATDVRPSRFEEARKIAKEAIQAARPGDQIAIIEAGPLPRVAAPLGNDPARLVRALDEISATDAEADTGESLRLASAIVAGREGARIVLLSDGVFEPVRNFTSGGAAMVYRPIGVRGDNLAISGLGTAETTEGRQLFVGVRNPGTVPIDGTVTIRGDGKVVDSFRTGAIGGGGQWGKTLAVPRDTKVFEAILEAPDVLKSDNYAVTVASAGASLRVLLVGGGDPFLERALALDPRVTLDRAQKVPDSEKGFGVGGQYDVIVFDGELEIATRARGVLAFGSPGEASPATGSGDAKGAKFLDADRHPLMKGVDFREVFIDRQFKVRPTSIGEVRAETSVGPLVITSQTASRRQIYVAFRPLESDFPLQVAFPIFVANALDFLAGSQTASDLAVRAGMPFVLPASSSGVLEGPDKLRVETRATGTTTTIRETRRVGRYDFQSGGKQKAIYAYLRSDRESDVAPVPQLALGGGTVKATAAPTRFADFWRPLLLLTLLVLVGEWWLFAKKS